MKTFYTFDRSPKNFRFQHIALFTRIVGISILILLSSWASAFQRPNGAFLFQPELEWANGKTTRQGTGYLLRYGKRTFGVTSMHFMDFEAGGLKQATWFDLESDEATARFRNSLGRLGAKDLKTYSDLQHDLVVLPLNTHPSDVTLLEIEHVKKYPAGTLL